MANDEINFSLKRTGSDEIVMAGKEVNQTLTLTNNSSYDISNIYVVDTASEGLTVNTLSVVIDGTAYPGCNPISGFTVPSTIKASNSSTITYTVTVADDPPSVMTVYSSVSYTANNVRYENELSNTYRMELADPTLVVLKTSDKTGAVSGETINYQIQIQNTGNLNQTNVVLKDTIPQETQLVDGSIKVDGETRSNVDLAAGFTVGNVYAKDKKVVSFSVKVL